MLLWILFFVSRISFPTPKRRDSNANIHQFRLEIPIVTSKEISLAEAKGNKLFYFVATVVPYRESDGRCLILKRDEREKVHPGRYGVPGGKLEWADYPVESPTRINGEVLDYEHAVEELLKRETKEEAGIELHDDFVYLDSTGFIRPDGIPVILTKFGGRYRSGEVVLEEGGFTGYAWVDGEEINSFECIDGICDEVRKTIHRFKSLGF